MTFPLLLVTGIAVGWVGGGSVSGLARYRPSREWMLLVALAALLIAPLAGDWGERWGLPLSVTIAGAWLLLAVRNERRSHDDDLLSAFLAMGAIGWLMNAAPIMANGAMPVSQHATASIGMQAFSAEPGARHIAASAETHLNWLGDVMPLRVSPLVKAVVSAGDLVLGLGLVGVIVVAMRRAPRRARIAG